MNARDRESVSYVIFAGVFVAGITAIACIADLYLGYPWGPFAGQCVFDTTFLLSCGLIAYMAWDTWHDLGLGHRSASYSRDIPVAQSSGGSTATERASVRRSSRRDDGKWRDRRADSKKAKSGRGAVS